MKQFGFDANSIFLPTKIVSKSLGSSKIQSTLKKVALRVGYLTEQVSS